MQQTSATNQSLCKYCKYEMATESKEDLIFYAKLCEKSWRFDEMVDTMKKVLEIDAELNSEERNLLSAAYKGAMSSRRTSWRSLLVVEKHQANISEQQKQVTEDYRTKIETELLSICQEVLECINEVLLPNVTNPEAKVYYLKMKGDYYRYMVELAKDEDREAVIELSKESYESGFEIANAELKPSNLTRLGLALNFAVLHAEVTKSMDVAYMMAKKTLDEAVAEIGTGRKVDKETEVAMQLIRENLDSWKPKDSGVVSALI